MVRIFPGAVLLLLVSAAIDAAWAACPVGNSCNCANSCVGFVTGPSPCRCDCSECPPPPPPPPPTTTHSGTVTPLYSILGVIYAPPGAATGGVKSSATYGGGSKTGTSVSSTKSFNSTSGISIKVGGGFFGTGATASAAFSAGTTSSSGDSISFTKSTNFTMQVNGDSAHDGINHDLDQIAIWASPKIDMSVTSGGTLASPQVTWFLNAPNGSIEWALVFVGELTGTLPMRPDLLVNFLQPHGIGPSEYLKIASADPFAFGPPATLDPNRFLRTTASFPYEPPPFPGGPTNVFTYTQTNDVTTSSTSTVSQDLQVSASLEGDAGFLSFVSSSFTVSQSFKFSYGWTTGDSRDTTESASLTIGDPSFGYTGPIDIAVYWDTLWHSWLFVPIITATGATPLVQGAVLDPSGAPAAGQQVVLNIGGLMRTTFTNAEGQYRFWDAPSGSGSVTTSLGGISMFTRTNEAVTANIVQ